MLSQKRNIAKCEKKKKEEEWNKCWQAGWMAVYVYLKHMCWSSVDVGEDVEQN